MCARISGGIPGPLSPISTTTQPLSREVRSRSCPLPPMASMALSIRFVHTWLSSLPKEFTRNGLVIPPHSNAAFEFVLQDCQGCFQAFHHIDVLYRRLVHVGVFLDRTDQVGDSRGATFDLVQQAGNFD